MNCERQGCSAPATCALALALYPPKAVMEFHKTDSYLTRLIFGLRVCDAHFVEAEQEGPFTLMPREKLQPIADLCRRTSNTAVDVEATRLIRVALDDPDLAVLEKKSRPVERNSVADTLAQAVENVRPTVEAERKNTTHYPPTKGKP